MPGLLIPDDWNEGADGFCDLTFTVPNSQLWRSLARGQMLNLAYPSSYDPATAETGGSSDTFDGQIAAGNDDAYQNANGGNVTLGADFVQSNSDPSDATRRLGGYRFQNVTIPPGATITEAYLSGSPFSSTRDDANVEAYGEKSLNPGDFSGVDIVSRVLTSNFVDWVQDGLGTAQVNSPDLTSVVQELIDQPGYASGNAMVFILVGKVAAHKDLWFISYNNTPALAVSLHVGYTVGGSTSPELAAEIGTDIFNSYAVDCP